MVTKRTEEEETKTYTKLKEYYKDMFTTLEETKEKEKKQNTYKTMQDSPEEESKPKAMQDSPTIENKEELRRKEEKKYDSEEETINIGGENKKQQTKKEEKEQKMENTSSEEEEEEEKEQKMENTSSDSSSASEEEEEEKKEKKWKLIEEILKLGEPVEGTIKEKVESYLKNKNKINELAENGLINCMTYILKRNPAYAIKVDKVILNDKTQLEKIKNYRHFTNIQITDNTITHLPTHIIKQTKLKKLNVKGCKELRTIWTEQNEEENKCYPNLEQLNIENTNIKKLPITLIKKWIREELVIIGNEHIYEMMNFKHEKPLQPFEEPTRSTKMLNIPLIKVENDDDELQINDELIRHEIPLKKKEEDPFMTLQVLLKQDVHVKSPIKKMVDDFQKPLDFIDVNVVKVAMEARELYCQNEPSFNDMLKEMTQTGPSHNPIFSIEWTMAKPLDEIRPFIIEAADNNDEKNGEKHEIDLVDTRRIRLTANTKKSLKKACAIFICKYLYHVEHRPLLQDFGGEFHVR